MTVSMRRHRKRKLKAEINVVPYIDVMLVLLIIFMVTAPLLNLGVDIDLPQTNAKSIQEKKDPVIVAVAPDGSLSLILKPGENQAMAAGELEARVRGMVAQNPDLPVFVAGDGRANYQAVANVLDLLQRAEVRKVGMLMQPQQQDAAR